MGWGSGGDLQRSQQGRGTKRVDRPSHVKRVADTLKLGLAKGVGKGWGKKERRLLISRNCLSRRT